MRYLRAPLLVLMMALLSWNTAASQISTVAAPSAGPSKEIELLQWGVTQGGLVLVVLVVVWSYRRDFQRVFDAERTKSSELLLALQASTTALTSHAEMLRENSSAAHEQAKALMELSGRVKTCELAQSIFSDRKE